MSVPRRAVIEIACSQAKMPALDHPAPEVRLV